MRGGVARLDGSVAPVEILISTRVVEPQEGNGSIAVLRDPDLP